MTEFTCTIEYAKKQRRWCYICGIMPWNWLNNDIWTAYVIWDRAIRSGKFQTSDKTNESP